MKAFKYLFFIIALLFFLNSPVKANDYYDYLLKSKLEDKKVFVYFGANWCSYCVKMEKSIKDSKFFENSDDYIFLKIDIDKNPDLKNKFKVGSIPDYLIMDYKEKIIKRNKGYLNTNDFLKWIK